jgi:putative oxidoreductase
MWAILSRNRDAGILILRILLGSVFLWVHGVPKLMGMESFGGDPVKGWQWLGEKLELWAISWPPPKFWGFLAMLTETGGVVLFILGLLFRPTCVLLVIVMAVAATYHFSAEKTFSSGLREASHAIEMGIVFFSMIFIGPGKYSIDRE